MTHAALSIEGGTPKNVVFWSPTVGTCDEVVTSVGDQDLQGSGLRSGRVRGRLPDTRQPGCPQPGHCWFGGRAPRGSPGKHARPCGKAACRQGEER